MRAMRASFVAHPNKESYACQVKNFVKFGRILQSIAKTKKLL
jgi:hypothetical protein